MCGISGIVSTGIVSSTLLQEAVKTIAYRGPDGEGIYISPDGKVGLGHNRLAFLDLSPLGKQPMQTLNEKLVVTYNGEIYNFKELRAELETQNYIFNTASDTEVLLHGYKAWGNELPKKLKGMFAFAIYDSENQKLFLARDRFGIKPLFYGTGSTGFVFGSEIKALMAFDIVEKKIRKQSVALFLANRYVPTPYTMWQDIYKLPPACYMEVDVRHAKIIKEEYYWRLEVSHKKTDKAEVALMVDELLQNSVKKHLQSDVQVGSFLSGGMDSTALVMFMKQQGYQPLDAFSIGFENWKESEHHYAKLAADALGAQLHALILERISMETVSTLMYHYDDPIADISILPTYAVSGLAATKVKAVLSGEGADECFGGYWWQQPSRFMVQNKWRTWLAKIFGSSFSDIKEHYIQAMSMGLYDHAELSRAFTDDWQDAVPEDPFNHFDKFKKDGIGRLKQIQYLDIHTFMSELILTKVDRASMAHSLEVRVPFLDHTLVEYLFSLDTESYFDPNIQKALIQQKLKGNVPESIYNRPKQGFVGPDVFYMDFDVYRKKLENGRLIKDGIIKSSYLNSLFENKDHWRLWKLFVLENWWEIWN